MSDTQNSESRGGDSGKGLQDARMYWTLRAGRTQRELSKTLREAFRDELKPKGGDSIRNVNDLAEGRTIALWIAAAMTNPEWGKRMLAWTLDPNDQDAGHAIDEIHRVMSFTQPATRKARE